LSNLIWLILASNDYPVEIASLIPVLGVENVITLGSFMCITGNTEDENGLSSYEMVAVVSGILWGVHTSHITHLVSKKEPGRLIGLEEPFEI
tara:strand:- start:10 stop:285 length:276 start_codon:yes stop_codon:yes gene_type:complete